MLSGLLTYRTNIAQDGVIRLGDGRPTREVRVAVMPSLFGERVTMRVLDGQAAPLVLDELGFEEAALTVVRRMLRRPTGLLILTGPTGCGKTTTIYAMVRELLRMRQDPASIISLEDPVENVIDGISQTAVPAGNAEWTYETALRAALRQDVKTLVVGEMRDRQVVHVVLDAALTGHRVITTYHAGDIGAVYARLLHQGFEPFLVAASVSGVVAQRLVPGRDGGRVPVVACHEADDAWREFICRRPELGAIRARLRELAGADLRSAAQGLECRGRIDAAVLGLVE